MSAEPQEHQHRWDAFVSHASEDKVFVRELVQWLGRFELRVWYDEFELKPGDSLVASIDRGLAESRAGILVISTSFLGKPWTEYERRGLTGREVAGRGELIPVWLDVTRDEVASLSPTLADKFAVVVSPGQALEAALRLLGVLEPQKLQLLRRRAAFEAAVSTGTPQMTPLSDLRPGKPIHARLPRELLLRISVVRAVFDEVFALDWTEAVDLYKSELHPEREVAIWESMAVVYLKISRACELNPAGRKELFSGLLIASSGLFDELEQQAFEHVSAASIREAYGQLEAQVATDD